MGARNESKATGAIKQLETEGLGNGEVVWLKLDLSDPRDAKKSAEEFLQREKRLDVLSESTIVVLVCMSLIPIFLQSITQQCPSDLSVAEDHTHYRYIQVNGTLQEEFRWYVTYASFNERIVNSMHLHRYLGHCCCQVRSDLPHESLS